MDIREVFAQHQGIVSADVLRKKGINYYQINRLVESGAVQKLKRGLYKWSSTDNYELVDVANMVKEGVFCLFTAAFFHGLTTFVPPEHHIAIPNKAKIRLPPYPFIHLYYWDTAPYNTGKVEILLNGAAIRLYSPEKTVCDIVKYRKHAGMDVLKEVLNTYLERPDRNIDQLLKTAHTLKIKNTVQNYIELLA
jgi:predicted transcriptional regulator of viral defense system